MRTLTRQILQRVEEPGFEPDHRVPQTNAAGEAPDDGPEEQEVRSQERGRDDRPWVDGSMKWLRIRLPQQSSGPVAELRDVLQRSGFTLETTTREWYLAGTIQVLNFLARHHKLLMTDNDAFFTHNLSHSLRNVDLAKAKCDASEENDGFRFAIGIDPEGKSPKVIQEALSSGRMFFYTDRGPRLITPELMESIRNAQRRITGEAKRDVDLDLNLKIGYADLASADAIAEEGAPLDRVATSCRADDVALIVWRDGDDGDAVDEQRRHRSPQAVYAQPPTQGSLG